MQTRLTEAMRATERGQEADRILRSCVHCGFCTATCPTYQLLGDELDGPRGRIYQIKTLLEGAPATREIQRHLDRCLTCRNCETTCPSGVNYHRLLDFGRELVEEGVRRPLPERLARWTLRQLVPYPRRLGPLVRLGAWLRPLLPAVLRAKLPAPQPATRSATRSATRASAVPKTPPPAATGRRVILQANCAEPLFTPATQEAAVRVLERLGIGVIAAGGGCCGAVSQHLGAPDQARAFMRRNIDAWWPHLENGAEAILVTASGCGAMVKDYGELLRDDPDYGARAARVAACARDLCELLDPADLAGFDTAAPRRIAFHPPCTLQHGQRLSGRVETLLRAAGFELVPVHDAQRCCGSAGTYAFLQPALAGQLRARKLEDLDAGAPALIATANVGCQLHLQSGTQRPVVHWIELLDPARHWATGRAAA